jgi:hypothetical protein
MVCHRTTPLPDASCEIFVCLSLSSPEVTWESFTTLFRELDTSGIGFPSPPQIAGQGTDVRFAERERINMRKRVYGRLHRCTSVLIWSRTSTRATSASAAKESLPGEGLITVPSPMRLEEEAVDVFPIHDAGRGTRRRCHGFGAGEGKAKKSTCQQYERLIQEESDALTCTNSSGLCHHSRL